MTTANVGITPTYMGNTFRDLYQRSNKQDHPHIHGEYLVQTVHALPLLGSPPHTWGIRYEMILSPAGTRITPTYMGNTTDRSCGSPAIQDHPHIHGEYVGSIVSKMAIVGSPPHTWGIPDFGFDDVIPDRITPTYMGNTVNRSLYDAFFRSLVCHF